MSRLRTALQRATELASGVAGGWILSDASTNLIWLVVPAATASIALFDEHRQMQHARFKEVAVTVRGMMSALALDPAVGARCTVHVPIGTLRKRFLQACDYVPDGGGGGRKHRRNKGILWKSYEAKAERTEAFHSDEEFRTKMTTEYNYSTAEMVERTRDRRSYFCAPIVEGDEVLGLLYLDARETEVFPIGGQIDRALLLATARDAVRASLLR